jgi:hypothetical protein
MIDGKDLIIFFFSKFNLAKINDFIVSISFFINVQYNIVEMVHAHGIEGNKLVSFQENLTNLFTKIGFY